MSTSPVGSNAGGRPRLPEAAPTRRPGLSTRLSTAATSSRSRRTVTEPARRSQSRSDASSATPATAEAFTHEIAPFL